MMKITKILACAFILSCSVIGHADEQTTVENNTNYTQAIEKLEGEISVLQSQKDNLDTQVAIMKEGINTRFDQKNLEMKDDLYLIYSIIALITSLGIAGILPLRSFIEKQAKSVAEEEVRKHVADMVEADKEKIIQLIENQDLELNIKKNSRILVICETAEDQNELTKFFQEVGIVNVSYIVNGGYSAPASNIDLVLFDDHRDTKEQHDLFKEYIEKSTDSELAFLFYGRALMNVDRNKFNATNSKFTLYEQIITTLKYVEFKKQHSS